MDKETIETLVKIYFDHIIEQNYQNAVTETGMQPVKSKWEDMAEEDKEYWRQGVLVVIRGMENLSYRKIDLEKLTGLNNSQSRLILLTSPMLPSGGRALGSDRHTEVWRNQGDITDRERVLIEAQLAHTKKQIEEGKV